MEFPRLDPRREGLAYRYGYVTQTAPPGGDAMPTRILRYELDATSAATTVCDLGPGRTPGEPVFVPAGARAGEDEGWLLTYVYDAARDASDLVIVNAGDLEAGPVAAVHLPVRVPYGFHGSWVADGEID